MVFDSYLCTGSKHSKTEPLELLPAKHQIGSVFECLVFKPPQYLSNYLSFDLNNAHKIVPFSCLLFECLLFSSHLYHFGLVQDIFLSNLPFWTPYISNRWSQNLRLELCREFVQDRHQFQILSFGGSGPGQGQMFRDWFSILEKLSALILGILGNGLCQGQPD